MTHALKFAVAKPNPSGIHVSMKYIHDDGGRSAAGFKNSARDCVTRAIAISSGLPYKEVYNLINAFALSESRAKKSSARNGVYKETSNKVFALLGAKYTATKKLHISDELPATGKHVIRLKRRHLAAWVEGQLHDTWNCSGAPIRGYWTFQSPADISVVRSAIAASKPKRKAIRRAKKQAKEESTLIEWVVETLNEDDVQSGYEDPEIIDLNHSRELDFRPLGEFERLALVGQFGGFSNSYAYPVNGIIPEYFDDGTKVPKRFQAELTKWIAAQPKEQLTLAEV